MSTPDYSENVAVPGRGLTIAGLVFAVLFPIVGLILSLMARNKAREAGVENRLAVVGIVISAVLLAAEIVAGVVLTIAAINGSL